MKAIIANKHTIKITHEDKLIFPEDNITKADLVDYYQEISDDILPFLKNRALIIQRFPRGIQHEGFFQQHASESLPEWFKTAKLALKSGGHMEHILCQDIASLLYLVEQGMITPHRWLSKIEKPDFPDLLIVDLDPPKNKFNLACKAAKLIKKLFEEKKLESFVMTTGSKGLHVVIPIQPTIHFDASRIFIKNTIQILVEEYPKEFTMEMRKESRGQCVYLDILRNSYGHTAVAPYAVRPLPGAPIATPLDWHELDDKDLNPQKYTVKNIIKRLKNKKSPWDNFKEVAKQSVCTPQKLQ